MLKRDELSLYTGQAGRSVSANDGRTKAKHDRWYRGFVDVKMGNHSIRYWPLKNCSRTGVTNQTLRTWIKHNIIGCEKKYRMYVLTRAEMEAINRIAKKHRPGNSRHTQITPEFIKEIRDELQKVRLALSKLAHKMPLDPEETKMLAASLQEK